MCVAPPGIGLQAIIASLSFNQRADQTQLAHGSTRNKTKIIFTILNTLNAHPLHNELLTHSSLLLHNNQVHSNNIYKEDNHTSIFRGKIGKILEYFYYNQQNTSNAYPLSSWLGVHKYKITIKYNINKEDNHSSIFC